MRKYIVPLIAFAAVCLILAQTDAVQSAYIQLVHFDSGGNQLVVESGGEIAVQSGGDVTVASGGEIEVESGGELDIQSGATLKLHGETVSATQTAYLSNMVAGIASIDSAEACMDTLAKLVPNVTLIVNPLASSCVTSTYYMLDDSSYVVAFWDSVGVAVHVDDYSYIYITP